MTTIVLAWIFRKIFKKFIRDSTHIMHNDPTNYKFIGHAISALIYIVGFSLALYEMDKFRPIAKSLMAGAGVAAVAIGFASQQALGPRGDDEIDRILPATVRRTEEPAVSEMDRGSADQ